MNYFSRVFLKYFFYLCFLVWTGMLISGCGATKKITTAINKKDTSLIKIDSSAISIEKLHDDSLLYIRELYNHLIANQIHFNTFSAKVKVHYEGSDGKDEEVTAFIRIEKDKKIWISITALLGIEVVRALITPDSVKLINKLDKVYQWRSVSYLQEVTHLPFDFNTMQSAIVGNPIYLDSNILYYHKEDQGISMLSLGDLFRNYLTLNKSDLSVKHCKLDDIKLRSAFSYDLTYGDYEKKDTVLFSTYRKISVAEKTRLDIEMTFKQYSFNENLNFPLSIPKNYKPK